MSGEEDVLDTWMDSSISVLNVTGWNGDTVPDIFPAQLRPQGHDIIRTWAFYTILRSVALTGSRPWDEILVNGMVLGEDGYKMSKSRGNIIAPEEIVEQYGADAFRQWGAAGAATGSDIMFNWNDVVSASRFQTKMWNIARFVLLQLQKSDYQDNTPVTALADRWLLAQLSRTTQEVTDAMEGYQFDRALKAIREFSWNILADNYIELVKGRLYSGGKERDGACRTLAIALDTLCRLLAPFTPHFAEECYSSLDKGSVHAQRWPATSSDDEAAICEGDMLATVVAEVRRFKHENGIALNAPLGKVTIFSSHTIDDAGDASRTLNADVHWRSDPARLERVIRDISFNMAVIGPALRQQAKGFMAAVRALPPEQVRCPPETILVEGEEIHVPPEAFTPRYDYLEEGALVDVITIGDVIVTIQKTA
jgi:valyl-tRNA synthetase